MQQRLFYTLTLLLLLTVGTVFGQNQTVKVNINNVPAREAFAQIRQLTNMTFVYAEKNVSHSAKVTLRYDKGEKLSVVLASLCRQLNLSYEIKDKRIMLIPAPKSKSHKVTLHIQSSDSKEPMIMARCELSPIALYAVTDIDGNTVIDNVPEGEWTLVVSYVGFNTIEQKLDVRKDTELKLYMNPTSLALNEVLVTAQQKASGASTSSIIGRQAIDHLQATSLADVMQLLPGHQMGNTDLTQQSNLQLRTLVNNNTSAFGSSVVVDGVPISNNGNVTQGQFSGTAFTGTDLRQVSADNIEQVEVIRGIPSAEYGDLTSGLVVVRSKAGVTPWQFKGKTTPELMNLSLGKGIRTSKAGIFNFSGDYAQAWSDPRQKTRSFHRYNFSVNHSYDITKHWHMDTKVRFAQTKDWTGNDPDAQDDGTYSKNLNTNWSISHRGRITVNKPLMRTLTYTAGLTLSSTDNANSSYVANSTGLLPIITAMETGYHAVPWKTSSYLAAGRTESTPGNVFLKVNDAFYFDTKHTKHSIKAGVEYHYDWNNGRGYYNEDETLPYRPNSDGRPRAFSDIPGLHQLNAYAEDNFAWNINKVNTLNVNFGLRFTSMQPFSDIKTTALSPRLNVSFDATKWLTLRAGIGLNSKTPGLNYLYPDKKYSDRVAANYMPQNDPQAQMLVYHTQVYDVQMSKQLKNATTTKIEFGVDAKLPWGGSLSFLAYQDRTPDGFGNATEYFTYYSDVFTQAQGLNITPGQPTTIDYNNPARHDLVFITTGKIGNTNSTVNRGVEIDFNLGEIKAINTSFFVSGAYQETKTWSTDKNTASVRNALLPSSYTSYGITPFKVVYPSGQDYTKYRRFLNTLRIVTRIPSLKMVASFTTQAIWYNWNHSFTADKQAIAWIDGNLAEHTITPDMAAGFIGMDAKYYATASSIPDASAPGIAIADLATTYSDTEPSKTPITWNTSFRLTKELGRIGGLSIYVNNALYYEPYLKNNLTTTLTQRNTGTFSFGAELSLNL